MLKITVSFQENNNNDDYTTNTNNTSSNTNLSSKQALKPILASTSQFVTVLLGLGVVVISKRKNLN